MVNEFLGPTKNSLQSKTDWENVIILKKYLFKLNRVIIFKFYFVKQIDANWIKFDRV